uniref:Ig-like domain-containing protein n=1 Tax=Callorhinchus milii TaxID=7868 RepID=A0A4W3H3U9_CALMI
MAIQSLNLCINFSLNDTIEIQNLISHCVQLLSPQHRVADGTSIQVTQHPEHIAINTGENVKFSCNFPDTKIIKANWWKQGESEYLRIDHKKLFGQESAGKASLELLDVRHQDSGIYYCAAVTPGKTTTENLTVIYDPILKRFTKAEGLPELRPSWEGRWPQTGVSSGGICEERGEGEKDRFREGILDLRVNIRIFPVHERSLNKNSADQK